MVFITPNINSSFLDSVGTLNETLKNYVTRPEIKGLQANYEPSIILCFVAAAVALIVSLYFLRKLTKRVKNLEAKLNTYIGENKNGKE